MKRRIFKNDIETLRVEGRAIMDSTIDSRFYNRVAAVNAVLSGITPNKAAGWFGMTGRSLAGWVKKVDEFGFESLKDKPRPGAPTKLKPEQIAEIDKILQSNPECHGFRVWDGPTLSALIKQRYNVILGARQCQRLFHKLGYSKVRPQTYPSKDSDNSEERECFLWQQRETRTNC